MQTIGGRAFYPLDPRPQDFDIEDIAHALAFVCRFGGHCTRFYSVAEHSVRVAHAIIDAGGTRDEQLYGLLHDAAEAYVGDMVWPLKQAREVAGYKAIEKRIESAIARRFGLADEMPAIVKHFDLVLLSTEKRDLMHNDRKGTRLEVLAASSKLGAWHCDDHLPLPERIEPWAPEAARVSFLAEFETLTRESTP